MARMEAVGSIGWDRAVLCATLDLSVSPSYGNEATSTERTEEQGFMLSLTAILKPANGYLQDGG